MRQAFPLVFASLVACGTNNMDDPMVVNCARETRAEPFVVGVDKAADGGRLDFKLIMATPAPPARNDNSWVIQVSSMTNHVIGAPLSNVPLEVTPYMPDHQHGNGIPVGVMPMPDGQYKLDPLLLGMPGYWEITLDVSSATANDSVTYKICIPS
jgi:hypothetical protein